jgi:MFS family permease
MGTLAPVVQEQFGLSLSQTSLVVAAVNIGPVLCLIGWGLVNDRWGERLALIFGMAGCAVALALAAKTTDYRLLCLLVFVASALGSTTSISTGRAVITSFEPPTRGLALGLRHTASPIGGALAGFALPAIAARSMGFAFAALASLIASGAIAAAIWLRSIRVASPAFSLPYDPQVWPLVFASAFFIAPQIVFVGLTAVMLTEARDLTIVQAGAVVGVLQIVGALLRILVGYWADHHAQPVSILRWACLIVALSTFLAALSLSGPTAVVVPVVLVCGSLTMAWNTISFALVAQYGGEHRSGYALGIHATVLFLAAAVAAPLFAALVETTSWQAAFATLTLAPAISWALMRRLKG